MKNLYYTFFIVILLGSCTETIDLELNQGENNRLVVEGSITNELKKHQIKLSHTGDYFSNIPGAPELNANVTISDGDTAIHLYDTKNKGIYIMDKLYAGKVGHTYTLNIQLENGEQYSASETLNPVVPMDSVKCEYLKSEFPFDKNYYYHINIFAQEDPEPGNHYQWDVWLDGLYVTDTLRLKVFTSDEFVNGTYISAWTVYRIPEQKIKKDTTDLTLQMLSISEEKYRFYLAVLLETDWSGGFFSGPPANVPSNISNGALGFFSASAVTEQRIKIIRQH